MAQEQWSAVDQYINDHLVPFDALLEATLSASNAAGLPEISVTPNQGKMLMIFAQMVGARRILEIGTLAGYSTVWLARGLAPGGSLVTLEFDPKHAEVAHANMQRAGLADVVEVRLGAALDTLPTLTGPFDLIFIDADKASNAAYFDWALRLSRSGSLIVCDNVVRGGAVLDESSEDPSVQGTRALFDVLANETRVVVTAVQTVGAKGYDGFALARVL